MSSPALTNPERVHACFPQCYVSTACVTWAGMADDCHELEALRGLRARFVTKYSDGIRFLDEYAYTSGPIIDAINAQPDRDVIWGACLSNCRHIVELIDAGDDAEAFAECLTTYDHLYLHFHEAGLQIDANLV